MIKRLQNFLFPKDRKPIKEIFKGDEIYLKDIFFVLWNRKLYFVPLFLVFYFTNSIAIRTSQKVYTASQTLLHEGSSGSKKGKKSGGFGDLLTLAQAGGNAGGFADPSFYTTIIESESFLISLVNEKLYIDSKEDSMLIKDYLRSLDSRNAIQKLKSSIGSAPSKLISFFKGSPVKQELSSRTDKSNKKQKEELSSDGLLRRNPTDMAAARSVSDNIAVIVDGNMFILETTLPDPEVAARFNQLVLNKLLNYVRALETKKERELLEYTTRRTEYALKKYDESRRRLAEFLDSNIGISTASAKIQEEELQSENGINRGIYQDLAKNLENSKLALQEKQPVFTVFEPVFVPTNASVPSFNLIRILIFTFALGFLIILIEVVYKLSR